MRRRGPLRDRFQCPLDFPELEAAGQLDPQVDLPGIARAQQRSRVPDGELVHLGAGRRPAFLESLVHRLDRPGPSTIAVSPGAFHEIGQRARPVERPVPRDVVDEAKPVFRRLGGLLQVGQEKRRGFR